MGMFTAMAVVSSVFLGSLWAGDNRAVINSFKRQNPTAFVAIVLAASYLLVSLLGSVMVFMSAITLPLICEFGGWAGGMFTQYINVTFCGQLFGKRQQTDST